MKSTFRVWGLVLMLLLLIPLSAFAEDGEVTVQIRKATLSGKNFDELDITVLAYSQYELKEVTAEVEGRKVALKALSWSDWSGKISLEGLPQGTYKLKVTVVTTGGASGTAEQDVALNGPTVIKIVQPENGTVVRGGQVLLRGEAVTGSGEKTYVEVAYTVDGSYHGKSLYLEAGKDTWFDVSDYEGTQITLHFTTYDKQSVPVEREIYVERSQRLSESLHVDGKLLDWNADRLLYKAGDSLHIKNRATGEVTDLPPVAYPTANEKLVGSGAIFQIHTDDWIRDPRYQVVWWNGSKLTELTPGLSGMQTARIRSVNGSYAVYMAPDGTYILNAADGKTAVIPNPSSVDYYWDALLDADGSALLAGLGLFRYHPDGTVTRLVEQGERAFTRLIRSGSDVVYTDGQQVYKYDGRSASVLKQNDGIDMSSVTAFLYQKGWFAYLKKSGTGSAQLFLRSPQGDEKQLTFLSSAPALQFLAEDGSVAYTYGTLTYIHPAGAAKAVEVSSSLGSTFHLPALGGWHQLLGSGLYQVLTGSVEIDKTPPAWPAGGELTVTDLTYKSGVLHWPAATDGKGIAAYAIYRDNQLIGVAGKDTLQYDIEVQRDNYNRFSVKAEDTVGNRSDTLEISIQAPEYDDRPPYWTTGKGLSVTDVTYTGAKLAWKAAKDNKAVLRYAIYRDDVRIGEVAGNVTKYTASGLSPATTYRFKIVAEDEFNQSAGNPEAVVTTPELPYSGDSQAPVWPGGSLLSVTDVTYTGASLHWTLAQDDVAVTSYDIYRDGQLLGSVNGNVYAYRADGLASGQTYLFSLAARDAAGHTSTGNPSVSVTTAVYGPGPDPDPGGSVLSLQAKPGFIDTNSILEIYLKADQAEDLYGFLSKVQYDPSRLKLAQVKLHPEFGTESRTAVLSSNTYTTGQVKLSGALLGTVPGRTGGPHLVTLKFKALQAGATDLTLLPGSALSDSQGHVQTLPAGTKLTVYVGGGDFDNDGRVGLSDLVLISKASGSQQGFGDFDTRFDINNDGKINASDVQYIADKVSSQ
ncbi:MULTISPECIES: fibronectin type III domain-containing protein [Paenibacillus]|uniref:fibronectin type III domain-containing protein n=1 Tax=Paenibacillus TaxID=44249 RepID=UPI0022B85C84|nr:dockerin type I domain-containing protein [Paenibacillus caseinilyticus]MCZ8519680.1 dockerin type I domain-containing protein [Paenibacillus caseinilyticus]